MLLSSMREEDLEERDRLLWPETFIVRSDVDVDDDVEDVDVGVS